MRTHGVTVYPEGLGVAETLRCRGFRQDEAFAHVIEAVILRILWKTCREIEVRKVETVGDASPVARVGLEKVSMKTDLIPPERMKLILVESARARLLNEVRTFVCTKC